MLFLIFFITFASSKLTLHQQTLHSKLHLKQDDSNVKTSTFTVPLDHFNANNFDDIKIRYHINDQHFDKTNEKAPLFVVLGGEGPAEPATLQGNFAINKMAEKHNALMLSIEHRFYGQSIPSLELSSLKYCTAEQTLMDFVEVITSVQEEYSIVKNPVIVLGGSYSGNLAAWMRQKYPNVVEGAWASSAPVEAKVDFYEYLEVVQKALPENTPELLEIAFQTWDKMTETKEGRKQLKDIFGTCTEFNEKDIQTFAESIGTALSGYVQYNSSFWKSNYETVDSISYDFMVDVVRKYPQFIKEKFNPEWAGQDCTSSSVDEYYKGLKNTKLYSEGNTEAAGRSWYFQTCIAYGYYQAVDVNSKVKWGKLNKLQGSFDMCKEIYGIDKDLIYFAVDHVNVRYGGIHPEVTHVAFTNGDTDPWHALSVVEQEGNERNLVQLLHTTSHCSDLYSEKEDDIPELKKARHNNMKFFEHILEDYPDFQ